MLLRSVRICKEGEGIHPEGGKEHFESRGHTGTDRRDPKFNFECSIERLNTNSEDYESLRK